MKSADKFLKIFLKSIGARAVTIIKSREEIRRSVEERNMQEINDTGIAMMEFKVRVFGFFYLPRQKREKTSSMMAWFMLEPVMLPR